MFGVIATKMHELSRGSGITLRMVLLFAIRTRIDKFLITKTMNQFVMDSSIPTFWSWLSLLILKFYEALDTDTLIGESLFTIFASLE